MRKSPIHLDADTAGVLRRDRVAITAGFVVYAAALVWRIGAQAVLPALLVFGLLAAALVVCDIRLLRLPDALTLPGYPLLAALLLIPLDGDAYGRGLIAMAAAYLVHLVLALAGVGVGLGDAKAAGLVGLVVGRLSWAALIQALVLAYVAVGLFAVVLAVTRRAGRGGSVPFGPFLLGAALVVILLHGA
ncbi:prepilin peptidase [Embleya hyalina]|uniref:Prepilin peptidase n=1 Tax=Embleya hyalina TaxID=516124 RepID=A0A401YSP1_9ACTN|nr:A24 family peptidase [Embleya hyalina]GCD97586.1 prepilin peptidase [Embleya hyalina]